MEGSTEAKNSEDTHDGMRLTMWKEEDKSLKNKESVCPSLFSSLLIGSVAFFSLFRLFFSLFRLFWLHLLLTPLLPPKNYQLTVGMIERSSSWLLVWISVPLKRPGKSDSCRLLNARLKEFHSLVININFVIVVAHSHLDTASTPLNIACPLARRRFSATVYL